jgi:hypothetical protein
MEPSIAASRVGCLYATVTALYAFAIPGRAVFHGDDAEAIESGQNGSHGDAPRDAYLGLCGTM